MTSGNVPATRGPSGQVSPYVRGMDPLKDFEPPTYRLLQGQSAAVQDGEGVAGQYYSPELTQAVDEIRAAVRIAVRGFQKCRAVDINGPLEQGAIEWHGLDDPVHPRY